MPGVLVLSEAFGTQVGRDLVSLSCLDPRWPPYLTYYRSATILKHHLLSGSDRLLTTKPRKTTASLRNILIAERFRCPKLLGLSNLNSWHANSMISSDETCVEDLVAHRSARLPLSCTAFSQRETAFKLLAFNSRSNLGPKHRSPPYNETNLNASLSQPRLGSHSIHLATLLPSITKPRSRIEL